MAMRRLIMQAPRQLARPQPQLCHLQQSSLLGRQQQFRCFSSATSSTSGEYESIQQDIWYTPNNAVTFTNSKFTVFSLEDVKERKFVPFEVKEATIKASLYSLGAWLFQVNFSPL
mmetsp:Transcript_7931/g.13311  ORF Transcript_7931/g.13311 Transcript_7931/m.13311 type:complete len:115 (-) Transcript_7931:417-761(-)